MGERVNPVSLHRRGSDPPEADFHSARRFEEREVIIEQPDTYTKWIVGIVGAGIITALTVLAARDRGAVDTALTKLDVEVSAHAATINSHEARIQVIRATQERVLVDLTEIRKQLDGNSDKLDKVLIELRRK